MTTIYVMTMTRTTVYLPLDANRRLSAAAHRQHRSEAELIMDAVNRLLAEEPEGPRPNPPRFDLDPTVVDHVDEYLSAGFGTAGLARRGVVADIYIFGGAAMALAYDSRRTTRDVDALFKPHGWHRP